MAYYVYYLHLAPRAATGQRIQHMLLKPDELGSTNSTVTVTPYPLQGARFHAAKPPDVMNVNVAVHVVEIRETA